MRLVECVTPVHDGQGWDGVNSRTFIALFVRWAIRYRNPFGNDTLDNTLIRVDCPRVASSTL